MIKKYRFFIITGIVLVILVLIAALVRNSPNSFIETAPDGAKVTINGQVIVGNKSIYLRPGTYDLSVTLDGFKTVKQSLIIVSSRFNQTAIILDPDSELGFTYLRNHPAEALHREAIGGRKFNQLSQQATTVTPLIKVLPFIAAGFKYRIDYKTVNDKTIIVITAPDNPSQQDAVSWIESHGYDVTTLTIEYVTAPTTSNLLPAVPENETSPTQ